jgi:hypothetical protein
MRRHHKQAKSRLPALRIGETVAPGSGKAAGSRSPALSRRHAAKRSDHEPMFTSQGGSTVLSKCRYGRSPNLCKAVTSSLIPHLSP